MGTYEGWSNRATWLANLWLRNERDLHDGALRTAATGIDRDWAMPHVGEMLVGDIMHEMQRLLSRGQTAMYFDFCPEGSDPVIPSINRVELAEHWVAEVVDHREHGEIIKPRLIGQVDYERSTCPACGDPDCHFPPPCQAVVYGDTTPERGYPHHDSDE